MMQFNRVVKVLPAKNRAVVELVENQQFTNITVNLNQIMVNSVQVTIGQLSHGDECEIMAGNDSKNPDAKGLKVTRPMLVIGKKSSRPASFLQTDK